MLLERTPARNQRISAAPPATAAGSGERAPGRQVNGQPVVSAAMTIRPAVGATASKPVDNSTPELATTSAAASWAVVWLVRADALPLVQEDTKDSEDAA